jgi:hypothetical protein
MSDKINDAPGFRWEGRKSGKPCPAWAAPRKAVAAGFRPKWLRLSPDLSSEEIAAACRRLQAEALEFLAQGDVGRDGRLGGVEGSLGRLIRMFQVDDLGPFGRVKWNTRQTYVQELATIERLVGDRQLHALGGRDFDRWYRQFRRPAGDDGPEHVARASRLINMVRMVIGFGVILEIPHCDRLALILSKMRFEGGRPRQTVLTAAMVVAFRRAAHVAGRPSVALATAIQFETALRQRDVIGEYAPAHGASPGPLSFAGKRWTTGLVWGEHIDPATLVMRKPTSKSRGRKVAIADLTLCPMVMAELGHVAADRRVGPVIVSESTGQPYVRRGFAKTWREIARKAGIPDDVENRDARAGAISEAMAAGAHPDAVRQMATHSRLNQTAEYSRAQLEQSTKVAALRVAKRNEP